MSADINKMCRTCLISDVPLLCLFDNKDKNGKTTSVVEMLQSISSIKATSSDGLPGRVCIFCISEINRAFLFKIKCESSQKTLQQLIDQEKSRENDSIRSNNLNGKQFEIELIKDENSGDKLVSEEINIKSDLFVENSEATMENECEILIDRNDYEQELINYIDVSTNIDTTEKINPNNNKRKLSDSPKDKCEQEHNESVGNSEYFLDTCKGLSTLKRNKDKLKCLDCPQEFIHKKNLTKHILKHHQVSKIISTDLLKNENISAKLLHIEEEKMHENQFQIENLGTVDNMIEECILKHKTFQNSNYAYKCKHCGAGFRLEKSLDFHIKLNRCTQKQFECFICKKVFISKNNLILHMDMHKNYLQCTKCSKSFEFEEALKEHLDTDHVGNNTKNQCPICRKSFTMLSALKDHQRIHSGEKPYLCSVCGKSFTQNTNLKQHVMRHSKIKPFKCEQCQCEFVSKGELNSHIRKHTGEHPFVCDTCGSKFTTSSSLLKHKRIHTGERPYACDYCPMRFAALGTMKNHRRTHTGEKPFICKTCNRGFSQQSDCVTHMRTHTGERPYICPICGLSFQQSGTMKTHYKKLHPTFMTDTQILQRENI